MITAYTRHDIDERKEGPCKCWLTSADGFDVYWSQTGPAYISFRCRGRKAEEKEDPNGEKNQSSGMWNERRTDEKRKRERDCRKMEFAQWMREQESDH